MVVGSIWLGWGTYQYVTLFTCMMILSGIIHGWNANQIAALNRVAEALKTAANRPHFAWEFVVLEAPEANAFCLPGGKVAVLSGLFRYTANDAELATVVSHEIAHALARHGMERSSQSVIQACGGVIRHIIINTVIINADVDV